MPQILELDIFHPSGRHPPIPFFNVSTPVHFGAGLSDDVMLVQFFLKKMGHTFKYLNQKKLELLVMDGKPGQKTQEAINLYQRITRFGPVRRDGIVDVALGLKGSLAKLTYTIIALNLDYHDSFPQIWPKLVDDPMLPPLLKSHPVIQSVK
jgi:hypothetical protein